MDSRNRWQILTASDPSAAQAIEEPEALVYDGEQLVQDIRSTLAQRSCMTIRGLAQIFKKIDLNKNRQIDLGELQSGLNFFGINLND